MSALQIITGDCRTTLKMIPDCSVHCIVTSPPYWGLRDYGVERQIGLEKSLDEFLDQIVLVFSELWRVLRDDGTCWLNLGDAYAGGGHGGGGSFARDRIHLANKNEQAHWRAKNGRLPNGFKHKELMGLPWRVAFALQAAGWYLRSDIIWSKPNPMPESVTDRPTKAHEYLFLLTKAPKYFYDLHAVKERATNRAPGNQSHKSADASAIRVANGDHRERTKLGLKSISPTTSRNRRSVWTISSAPYRGAHFATFPPELIRPCILAGTSAHGCCLECGTPYARVIEKGKPDMAHQRACGGDVNGNYFGTAQKDFFTARAQDASATKARILAGMVEKKTIGWNATCECGALGQTRPTTPCTVLDPFAGSGTTGMVSLQENRNAILIELNPKYVALIEKRCAPFQTRKAA